MSLRRIPQSLIPSNLWAWTALALVPPMLSGCKSRVFESPSPSARILESRAPFPGETEGRPVMDASNYLRFTQGNPPFGRDGIESESVQGLAGLSTQELMEFVKLSSGNGNRGLFERAATPRYAEYFAIGTLADENVPWTSEAHGAREFSPYVPLRTENSRLTVRANGELDASSGTDYMIDTYYDTPDYLLLTNGVLVRSRNRQDRPGVGRRVLVQSKISLAPDGSQLKRVRKRDIRTSDLNGLSSAEIDQRLDASVRSGLNVLEKGTLEAAKNDPLLPFIEIYKELNQRNLLPNLDGKERVLLLNPQAVVFSTRSRFHFRLIDQDKLIASAQKAPELAQQLGDAFHKGPGSKDDKSTAKELANRIASNDFIAQSALPGAMAYIDDTTVDELKSLTVLDTTSLNRRQVFLAHEIAKTRKRLSQELSTLTQSLGKDWERKRHQLEHAGTAGLSLWFLKASAAFGEKLLSGGDFMIDSFDYVNAIPFADHLQLTDGQRNMSEPLPKKSVFFASLTSDAQIELTEDVTFDDCINKAKAEPQNPELQKDKKMCEFLLGELSKAQTLLTTLRGQEVLRLAEDSGFKKKVRWEVADSAKGEHALRIARDLPPPLPRLSAKP